MFFSLVFASLEVSYLPMFNVPPSALASILTAISPSTDSSLAVSLASSLVSCRSTPAAARILLPFGPASAVLLPPFFQPLLNLSPFDSCCYSNPAAVRLLPLFDTSCCSYAAAT